MRSKRREPGSTTGLNPTPILRILHGMLQMMLSVVTMREVVCDSVHDGHNLIKMLLDRKWGNTKKKPRTTPNAFSFGKRFDPRTRSFASRFS
jgi:hypothetical protein